jgi:hypothetical protein
MDSEVFLRSPAGGHRRVPDPRQRLRPRRERAGCGLALVHPVEQLEAGAGRIGTWLRSLDAD